MTDPKKIRVQFAPGCFDDWDGTQEELDEFVREITALAESGELHEHGRPMTEEDLADLDEDTRKLLLHGPDQDRKLQ